MPRIQRPLTAYVNSSQNGSRNTSPHRRAKSAATIRHEAIQHDSNTALSHSVTLHPWSQDQIVPQQKILIKHVCTPRLVLGATNQPSAVVRRTAGAHSAGIKRSSQVATAWRPHTAPATKLSENATLRPNTAYRSSSPVPVARIHSAAANIPISTQFEAVEDNPSLFVRHTSVEAAEAIREFQEIYASSRRPYSAAPFRPRPIFGRPSTSGHRTRPQTAFGSTVPGTGTQSLLTAQGRSLSPSPEARVPSAPVIPTPELRHEWIIRQLGSVKPSRLVKSQKVTRNIDRHGIEKVALRRLKYILDSNLADESHLSLVDLVEHGNVPAAVVAQYFGDEARSTFELRQMVLESMTKRHVIVSPETIPVPPPTQPYETNENELLENSLEVPPVPEDAVVLPPWTRMHSLKLHSDPTRSGRASPTPKLYDTPDPTHTEGRPSSAARPRSASAVQSRPRSASSVHYATLKSPDTAPQLLQRTETPREIVEALHDLENPHRDAIHRRQERASSARTRRFMQAAQKLEEHVNQQEKSRAEHVPVKAQHNYLERKSMNS